MKVCSVGCGQTGMGFVEGGQSGLGWWSVGSCGVWFGGECWAVLGVG